MNKKLILSITLGVFSLLGLIIIGVSQFNLGDVSKLPVPKETDSIEIKQNPIKEIVLDKVPVKSKLTQNELDELKGKSQTDKITEESLIKQTDETILELQKEMNKKKETKELDPSIKKIIEKN